MKFIQLLSLNNTNGFAELCALADNGSVWVWIASENRWKELKRPALHEVSKDLQESP